MLDEKWKAKERWWLAALKGRGSIKEQDNKYAWKLVQNREHIDAIKIKRIKRKWDNEAERLMRVGNTGL